MKSFAVAIVLLFTSAFVANVSSQVILEVPGYAVINGTNETSTYTERPFYAFRSVYYAEKPSPENRFLVSSRSKYIYILGKFHCYFCYSHPLQKPRIPWTKFNRQYATMQDVLNRLLETKIAYL